MATPGAVVVVAMVVVQHRTIVVGGSRSHSHREADAPASSPLADDVAFDDGGAIVGGIVDGREEVVNDCY